MFLITRKVSILRHRPFFFRAATGTRAGLSPRKRDHRQRRLPKGWGSPKGRPFQARSEAERSRAGRQRRDVARDRNAEARLDRRHRGHETRRQACDDDKLDLINGQVLELPNRHAEEARAITRALSACSTTGRQDAQLIASRSRSARAPSRRPSATPAPASASRSSTPASRRWHDDLTQAARRRCSVRQSARGDVRRLRQRPHRAVRRQRPRHARRRHHRRQRLRLARREGGHRAAAHLVVAEGARRATARAPSATSSRRSTGCREQRDAYNIRVVNLSVGAAVHESYWTDPLTLAAKRARRHGHRRRDGGRQPRARTRRASCSTAASRRRATRRGC